MAETETETEVPVNSPSTPPLPELTREQIDAWMEYLDEAKHDIDSMPYTPPEVVGRHAQHLVRIAETLLSNVRPVERSGPRVGAGADGEDFHAIQINGVPSNVSMWDNHFAPAPPPGRARIARVGTISATHMSGWAIVGEGSGWTWDELRTLARVAELQGQNTALAMAEAMQIERGRE